jgi:nucleoside-triphosphatase THEP1
MSGNIYIFSRPIRTGKTTELEEWIKDRDDVAGVFTPDREGRRCLLDISTNMLHEFEVSEPSASTVSVGKFFFSAEAFELAQDILLHSTSSWLIIDEVGKLEVEQHTGLEPAVSRIISYYHNASDINARLLLVVRDTLLEKAIDKYHLQDAHVIHSLQEL